MESSSINLEITNTTSASSGITSTLTDLGAALVFGLGFYFFKSHFKKDKDKDDKGIKDKMKPLKEKIEDTINKWESSISLQKINNLLKTQVTDKTFDPFSVLDQMQKSSLTPDITIVNTLIETTSRLKDFNNFKRLCELICSEKGIENLPAPNIITYNVMLKGISVEIIKKDLERKDKEASLKKVEAILNHLLSSGLKPNDITLNTLIDIMVDTGNFDQAWAYYDEMQSKYGIEPDIYTYSTLLKSIKNHEPDQKNIERAFNILKMVKLSKAKGIKPDEILYNCIIDTCIKYNRCKQAETLFNDMKEAGVAPTKITYAIMIKGYGNDYNYEKALEVFNEMKLNGIPANDITYGCLLNAAVKSNKIEKVIEIYDEMKNLDIPINNVIYTTLIKGFTKVKNFEKAFDTYERLLKDKNVEPNTVVYNSILDCCVECGNSQMMSQIYEDFKSRASENENYAQPDLITYSTVIKGYGKLKNIDKVHDIYNYLKGREDFVLDEVMFNTILDGMLKAEKFEEALKIYDDMKANQIKRSNATYSILIKIHSKMNSVAKAVEVYNEMLEAGIKPSLITYTAILQILIKSKRIQNAIEIFDEIIFNDILPDQVMYNVIINGCIFNGRLNDAIRFLMRTFVSNIRLCEDVYKNALCNLLTCKTMDFDYKCDLTMKVCKELKSRGLKIDYELYYKVMKMIYKNNGRKADSCAQKETEEYKSSIESQKYDKPNYYNKKYTGKPSYNNPNSVYYEGNNQQNNTNNNNTTSWRK